MLEEREICESLLNVPLSSHNLLNTNESPSHIAVITLSPVLSRPHRHNKKLSKSRLSISKCHTDAITVLCPKMKGHKTPHRSSREPGGLENVTNEAWANFMRNTQNSEATSINGSKKRASDSSPPPNHAAPSVPKTPPQKPNRVLQSATVENFVTLINSAWEAATRLKTELSPPALDESVKKKIEDIYVMFGAPLPKFPDITPLSIALEHATATCKSLAQMNATLTAELAKVNEKIMQTQEPAANMPKTVNTTHSAPAPSVQSPTSQNNNHHTIIHSANPIPIKPTKKPNNKPPQPTLPSQKNHPSRLIIATDLPLPIHKRNIQPDTVRRINMLLKEKQPMANKQILAAYSSARGNIVVVGAVGTHAVDLTPLKEEIVSIIDDGQPYRTTAWQDKALYRKKLDGVPTRETPGSDPYNPEQILTQLRDGYSPLWDQFSPTAPPSWLASNVKL
ncbi:uncharacterized protein EI90DRAFT_3115331 [Cantharellus anzutake]|uniref:uncharacterized protein n=1 Tax=Cantharellus anzutake TaxID=1750568 RepID=UPI001905D245|nr:uncharacterized protein EI90DRAFT_3115331 [Cantharellus anzutake]KAF8342790.1 hypothetical protein EI90DRAFT_3115331 [Cantharellus anzutake]